MRTLALAGALALLASSSVLLAPAGPALAADSDIRINEVQSDDPAGGADWVELTNTGSEAVDVSDWLVKDSDDSRTLRLPAGTQIAPGEFFSVEPDTTGGFGLGSDDAFRLYAADGTTLIDEVSWADHATTEGRLPDGTGDWADLEPTRDGPNAARAAEPEVVPNEVESSGDARGDWIELANTNTEQTADVSGWTLTDSGADNEPLTLPEGSEIESGGYLGVVTDGSFGLGGADSVTVRDASGAVIDSYAWEAHASATYARCPDMTGDVQEAAEATFELPNACDAGPEPEVDAAPWPFTGDVRDAVAVDTWGEDMSGIDYSSEGALFAVNNDNAEIFELSEAEGGQFSVARSWVPRYPDGTGQPDAEGLTLGGDGSVYLATERDNTASDVSRPSILKVELGPGGESSTTEEWDVGEELGSLGANAGLEGVEWISDADATRLGVLDNGEPYDPAAYGEHSGGIFAFSVEQTGELHLAVLEDGGSATILQTATPGPAVPIVMGLDWRAGGNELWAQCDEACDNRLSRLTIEQGSLTWQEDVLPPSGMPPGYTNEGVAMLWCEADPAADPTVAWISDTAHEGVSLRVADGERCAAPPPSEGPDDPPSGGPSDVPTGGPGESPAGAPGDDEDDDTAGGGGTLPRTGVEGTGALTGVACALVLGGATLLLLSRRRAGRREPAGDLAG